MPFSSLRRNETAIKAALYEDPSGSLIATSDMKIIFPVRYEEANLANMLGTVYGLGIFAIQVGQEYAVNVIPAKIRLFPTDIEKVTYQDNDYYVLSFEKGSTVTDNVNVVKDQVMGYYIYKYFVSLGRVPWYMSSADMLHLFSGMNEYTGVTYGANHAVNEMIISMIMRDNRNIQDYWRQGITTEEGIWRNHPDYIPLANVPFGARNTTAKLMGAYFDEGLNSALVYPSDTPEYVETVLRQ